MHERRKGGNTLPVRLEGRGEGGGSQARALPVTGRASRQQTQPTSKLMNRRSSPLANPTDRKSEVPPMHVDTRFLYALLSRFIARNFSSYIRHAIT